MFCKQICKMAGGGIAYGFGNLTDRKIGVGQQMLGVIQTNGCGEYEKGCGYREGTEKTGEVCDPGVA